MFRMMQYVYFIQQPILDLMVYSIRLLLLISLYFTHNKEYKRYMPWKADLVYDFVVGKLSVPRSY